MISRPRTLESPNSLDLALCNMINEKRKQENKFEIIEKDPWNNMESSTLDLAINALQEAQKRIDNRQLAYAVYGGPGFFIGSKGGKWLQEQGVEVMQLASCEIVTRLDLWADVFNAYIQSHKFCRSFTEGGFVHLRGLIERAHEMNNIQLSGII